RQALRGGRGRAGAGGARVGGGVGAVRLAQRPALLLPRRSGVAQADAAWAGRSGHRQRGDQGPGGADGQGAADGGASPLPRQRRPARDGAGGGRHPVLSGDTSAGSLVGASFQLALPSPSPGRADFQPAPTTGRQTSTSAATALHTFMSSVNGRRS